MLLKLKPKLGNLGLRKPGKIKDFLTLRLVLNHFWEKTFKIYIKQLFAQL